jgi:glutamyl-tRNA synthetase
MALSITAFAREVQRAAAVMRTHEASFPPSSRRPRGRLAPSPTGLVHLGNARTALATWLSVRAAGGTLVWRLEDLDRARVVPGLAAAAEEDLTWLGLDWDESPSLGGPHGPYAQSARIARYERALDRLLAARRIFPCELSRKDLEGIASAPHAREGEGAPVIPRPRDLPPQWLEDLRAGRGAALAVRFAVEPREIVFADRVFGVMRERVADTTGDFVVRRRDSVFAYQLAVVVDDIEMEIDEVVRGADLLESTARQIELIEALHGVRPAYAHVPLVRNCRGEKLAKRDGGLTLRSLRDAGIAAEQVAGYLASSLGLLDRPLACTPGDLVARFHWPSVRRDDLVLPADIEARLRAI